MELSLLAPPKGSSTSVLTDLFCDPLALGVGYTIESLLHLFRLSRRNILWPKNVAPHSFDLDHYIDELCESHSFL